MSRGVFSSASDGATLSRVGIDGNGIGGDSDGYLLGILSNHGIVGGDDTDLVLSIGHIGNLCSDVAAGIRGDATQFRRIAETAVGVRQLCDNHIGRGIEVVGRHGSRQGKGDGDGIARSKISGGQVSHAKGGVVYQQGIVKEEIVAGVARAWGLIGGGRHQDVTHVSTRPIVIERDAQATPSVGAARSRSTVERQSGSGYMHVGGVFRAISHYLIVCITMDDSFHLCLGACAVRTETHPNGKGVGQHGKRHVEGTFATLGLIVIV